MSLAHFSAGPSFVYDPGLLPLLPLDLFPAEELDSALGGRGLFEDIQDLFLIADPGAASSVQEASGGDLNSIEKSGKTEKIRRYTHVNKFSSNQTFKCEKCSKVFAKRASLSHHLRVHEKPKFVCTLCGRFYKYEPKFEKHLETCDGKRRPAMNKRYECK